MSVTNVFLIPNSVGVLSILVELSQFYPFILLSTLYLLVLSV